GRYRTRIPCNRLISQSRPPDLPESVTEASDMRPSQRSSRVIGPREDELIRRMRPAQGNFYFTFFIDLLAPANHGWMDRHGRRLLPKDEISKAIGIAERIFQGRRKAVIAKCERQFGVQERQFANTLAQGHR